MPIGSGGREDGWYGVRVGLQRKVFTFRFLEVLFSVRSCFCPRVVS